MAYCVKEDKACVGWVYKHFKDCVCNSSDELSFRFGVVSLLCWAIAIIPQVVTNFRIKSAHAISLIFVVAWTVGGIFNLVGCLLEPVTLPSQLYTAVFFTTITVTLLLQSLYYDYLYKCWKSGPSALGIENDNFIDDENVEAASKNSFSKTRSIPRFVGYGAFLTASMNMPQQAIALMTTYVAFGGGKLLQHSTFGQCLGWMMTAIYLGGRVAQIWLNFRRGSVKGLNPFMFIFAIIANYLYVGSIVVRTTEWDKIKPNLPWLLDAAGCAILDKFILFQFIYYKNFKKKALKGLEGYGDYTEVTR